MNEQRISELLGTVQHIESYHHKGDAEMTRFLLIQLRNGMLQEWKDERDKNRKDRMSK